MAPTSEPHWYHHLTFDTLVLLLRRSFFHPFICLLIPLCLRACAKPYTSPSMLLSFFWAGLVITYRILSALNRRIAYGAPREMDWEEEVVVITGGASGLGKVLAEMYGMRGASVAVLDLRVPKKDEREQSEGLSQVKWVQCDVSKWEDVERAKAEVEKDLGTPTILVNNVAAPLPSPPLPLTSPFLTPSSYMTQLDVNLLSHFHTLHAFLPSMLTHAASTGLGGHVVTISSVLGKLGAANLAPYTASKAGLLAMHASLTAELRAPTAPPGVNSIKTILVTPGQLSTGLFSNVRLPWYAHFLGPVVEPVELAREIVAMIDAGDGGEISLPVYAGWIDWVFVLPRSFLVLVRWVAGIDRAFGALWGREEEEGKKEK